MHALTYRKTQSWCDTLWSIPLFAVFLSVLQLQSLYPCVVYSAYYNNLLALPLLSYLSVACWSFSFFCSGAGSFRRHAQFLSSPRWKNKLPVCSWLVVTPLNFWVCMEGGVRGRECLPPPLNASNNPPSHPPLPLTDHWALSLLGHCEHFPPIRMDSSRVRGHVWPFMDQWGAGGG